MNEFDYKAFQVEMSRLKSLRYEGYGKTLRNIGIGYLGSVNHSAKIRHNYQVNVLTYCVYLSAADNAYGLEVCNKQTSRYCRESCLVGSGQSKVNFLGGKTLIQDARDKKTMLYFANRELFCHLLDVEIQRYKRLAEKRNMVFSIRFNCTSDIPLTSLNKFPGGQNILERFPDVIMYDYTKRPLNLKIAERYSNYHVVLSYYKGNDNLCKEWLDKGNSIAVVFGTTDKDKLPKTFMGHEVIAGDEYDARFLDKKNVVVGLKYKVSKNDFKKVNGHYVFQGIPTNNLIVPVAS